MVFRPSSGFCCFGTYGVMHTAVNLRQFCCSLEPASCKIWLVQCELGVGLLACCSRSWATSLEPSRFARMLYCRLRLLPVDLMHCAGFETKLCLFGDQYWSLFWDVASRSYAETGPGCTVSVLGRSCWWQNSLMLHGG
ncbi:hypothetical protein Nepgr_021665 [Nepenthes gracilis]|uniref:Uncharacterized protein n=1 Tax=Nepenthes gracilis TaxID=150966 RepID=A0AAD3SZ32_NEPGR|nr:hypothetical protein Nepgr_021665 [Nepenthes gracilis]